MTRISTPCSRRCVAKQCRKVCTVTDASRPAARTASRQARCTDAGSDRALRVGTWEQQALQTRPLPIVTQDREQLFGQHHIAILATFALAYDDDHAVAVDVLVGQCDGFGDPQSGGIDRNEDRPHLQIGRALQQAHDLVARQDRWQCVGLAPEGKVLSHVGTPERRTVKESNAAYDRDDGGGGRPREIKWRWYSRTFSNVSLSGDFMKCRLRFLTARDVGFLVNGDMLRMVMSSIMRCRSGEICWVMELLSIGLNEQSSQRQVEDQRRALPVARHAKGRKFFFSDLSKMALLSHSLPIGVFGTSMGQRG